MAPPPHKPMTGLSLYSGITFSSQAATDSVASTSASADATDSSSSKAAGDNDSERDKASAPQPSASSSWSAALRFAPRKSTGRGGGAGGAKSRPRPPAAALVASAFSSAPVDDASSEDTGSDAAQAVDSPITPAPSVHDVHAGTSRSKFNQAAAAPPAASLPASSSSATLLGPLATTTFDLPVITAPPALSLSQEEIDADRELARQAATARGDRRGGGGGGGGWGQESGSWRHGGDDEYGHDEDEDEDVNGFLASSAGAKARKKKNKRKRHAPVAPAQQALDYDADYDPRVPNEYATWRDVLRTRRRAIKERQQRREEYEDDEEPSWNRAKMRRWDDRAQPDDEEEEEEKLYLSPPPQPQAALLPPGPPPLPPPPSGPPPSKAISGEEAYQRRLAMSSGAAAQPPIPQQADVKPPTMNPAEALAARQSAAAAIAARLAKAAPPSAPAVAAAAVGQDAAKSSSSIDQHPADFAQRVMAQWGHTEGQGLGADEANRGRAEALVMEKVGPNKKRQWGPGSSSSSAPAPPARGKYTTQDPRAQQDLERFGPPSRVVLLEGIIESHEEVDSPSAASEIEEEVRSAATAAGPGSGIVERVQLAPPTRVFVVFTGMAGAWKCVRELDGRFFAGRRVRAAYYDEGALLVGDYWRH